MRGFTALMLSATLAGCATMTVSSHIERDVDFSEYVTFDWGGTDALPAGDPRLDNNPFFRDYVQGAIEKRMAAKGYELAMTGAPDLLVHYHASVSQESRLVEFEQGTLVIDVVDARTSKVIWRGWSQDVMTGVIDDQRRLEHQVEEGVTKMMLQLPRGGAALR